MLWNKLRYLLLLVAVALLAVLYNGYHMGIIFLTSLALPIVIFGLLCYIYGKVQAELVTSIHVAGKGEVVPITVQINNPTIFPISNLKVSISYKNAYSKAKYSKEFQASVDGRTKTYITFYLCSEYAGNLSINLKGIRVYDYLKLFSLKRKLSGEVTAAILPYYYELPESYLMNRNTMLLESDSYSPFKSGDDPSEVFAIREYREGDRLQRIHWKLSLKQGQLMIKEFSDPTNCAILLLVNLSVPNGEPVLVYLDAILECALSLSLSFIRKGQMHYLSWFDIKNNCSQRVKISQEKDLYEAVDGLLRAHPYSKTTEALGSYQAEHPNDQYADLYYVTGEMSTQRLDHLCAIKAQARQIIYVEQEDELTGDEGMPTGLVERSQEMGIDLWSVNITNVKKDMELIRIGS